MTISSSALFASSPSSTYRLSGMNHNDVPSFLPSNLPPQKQQPQVAQSEPKLPTVIPFVLVGSGLSILAFAGLWLANQKKHGIAASVPFSTERENALAKGVDIIAEAVEKTIETEIPVPPDEKNKATLDLAGKKQVSTKGTQSWIEKKGLGIVAGIAAVGFSLGHLLPSKNPVLVKPTLTPTTENIAKAIPSISQNLVYQLGFNCVENALQVSKSSVKNPESFPPVIAQVLEKFSTSQACSATLPVLTTWGTNRPSPFLLGVYSNNQFVGIQIPKKLSKNELEKISLEALSAKFTPDFGTLVWFNTEVATAYEKLPAREKKQQFEIRYLAIAPRIDTSKVDLKQAIPIEIRYLPEELKPIVGKAFSLINASPEGRELLEQSKKYKIALQYLPDNRIQGTQNGSYNKDTNAVFLSAALLNQQNLATADGFNFLVKVLIHELGHGVIDNQRLIVQGKPRPPARNIYDQNGNLIAGVIDLSALEGQAHLEEMTVNTVAVTVASQLVGQLPLFQINNAPLLRIDTSIDFAKKYGFYSHPDLANLAFQQETPTKEESDTIYHKLGLGDFTWNRVLATEVYAKIKALRKG